MSRLLALLLVLATTVTRGDTNTPYPAGTHVSVTTNAGTVTGVLQNVTVPQWISVLEANSREPTLLRGSDLILRRASATDGPLTVASSGSFVMGRSLRSDADLSLDGFSRRDRLDRRDRVDADPGHYIFGRPRAKDDRFKFRPPGYSTDVGGLTILVREAFTLGHYDKMKGPAWVAMRWTADDYARGEGVSMERGNFIEDDDLPIYARGGINLEFNRYRHERGHMCPDNDLESWGFPAVREGMRMSNVIPQRKGMNHAVWGLLEKETHDIVSLGEIEAIWIVSGPIFSPDEGSIVRVGIGNAIPEATYKVIAWIGEEDQLNVRAYIIAQQDSDVDLTEYLVSVAEVESQTGLDFFHAVDDAVEASIEAFVPSTLWD